MNLTHSTSSPNPTNPTISAIPPRPHSILHALRRATRRFPGVAACIPILLASLMMASTAEAGIRAEVSAGPSHPRPGERLDVEIVVTNDGASARSDVVVTLDYPPGLSSIFNANFDGSCPLSACEPGEIATFVIPVLPAGGGVSFALQPTVSPAAEDGTTIPFLVQVFDDLDLEATASTSVTVDPFRGFDLGLTEDHDPVLPGDLLTYRINYGVLVGTGGAADAVLRLPLPPGTSFVSASDGGTFVSGAVIWPLGDVSPGRAGQRRATVQVLPGVVIGAILETSATFDDALGNFVSYPSLTRVAATSPLRLAVTVTPDPAQPGELIDAEVTVSNASGIDRADVIVSLHVPELVDSFFVASFDGTCPLSTCDPGEIATIAVGTLRPGEGRSFRLPLTVGSAVESGKVALFRARVRDAAVAFAHAAAAIGVETARPHDIAVVESRDPVEAGELFALTLTAGVGAFSGGASGATLRLPLPDGAAFVSASDGGVLIGDVVEWPLGSLAPGANRQRRVVLEHLGEFGSIVDVGAAFRDLGGREVRGRTAVRQQPESPWSVSIVLTPDPARPGEFLDAEIAVANRGEIDRSGVVATLTMPEHVASFFTTHSEVTCPLSTCDATELGVIQLGTVRAGEGTSRFLPLQITPTAPVGGVMLLRATVFDASGEAADGAVACAITDVRPLDLAIQEQRDPNLPAGTIEYALDYGVSASSDGAPSATLRLPIPAGLSFSATSDGGSISGGAVTWSLGTLMPGMTGQRRARFAVDGSVEPGAIIPVTAHFADTMANATRASTSTRIEPDGALRLTVTVGPDAAIAGEFIDAELTVSDAGAVERTGVVVTLRIPEHIASIFNANLGAVCPLSTCDTSEAATFTIGTLAPGTGRSFHLPLRIAVDTPAGIVLPLRAQVADATGRRADTAASVAIEASRVLDLALVESHDPALPGDLLEFVATYGVRTDSGGALGATLRLPVPTGTTFVSASDGGTLIGGEIVWTLGDLNRRATGTRRAVVALAPGAVPGSIVTARARLRDGSGREIRYDAATRVALTPDLRIAVTGTVLPARQQETIDARITVTNAGPVARTSVTTRFVVSEHLASFFNSNFDGTCPLSTCDTQETALITIGTLAAGESRQFTIPLRVSAETVDGVIGVLRAHVQESTGLRADHALGFGVDSTRLFDLALASTDEPVLPGETITYVATCGAFASSGGATGVVLDLELPAGTSLVSTDPPGVLVVDPVAGPLVRWSIGGVSPSTGVRRSVTVVVDDDTLPGTLLRARAELRTASDSITRCAAELAGSVRALAPLSVDVIVNTIDVDPGAALPVTLCVTNHDAIARNGVVLRMVFPQGPNPLANALFGGSCPLSACEADEVLAISVGTLAAGATACFPLPMTVALSTVEGTVIPFVAWATEITAIQASGSAAVLVGDLVVGGGTPGDLNGDGVVDGADLGLLLSGWGGEGPGDLNADGVVNGADLGLLLGLWGG